jgi:hypothetical protein
VSALLQATRLSAASAPMAGRARFMAGLLEDLGSGHETLQVHRKVRAPKQGR